MGRLVINVLLITCSLVLICVNIIGFNDKHIVAQKDDVQSSNVNPEKNINKQPAKMSKNKYDQVVNAFQRKEIEPSGNNKNDSSRIIGIVYSPNKRMAVFDIDGGGRNIKNFCVGDEMNNMRIIEIWPDKIVLKNRNGSVIEKIIKNKIR